MIKKKKYDEQRTGRVLGKNLKVWCLKYNLHPTKILKYTIKEVYGHDVNLIKLIRLIESSPLPKVK
jgi:hypothetical protein